MQGRDAARHRHEILRERRHVLDLDADREARRHFQMLARMQIAERELDRQRGGARDQDFRMLAAQQMIQPREKALDFIFALRHLGGLVGLQDVSARGGRHAQRLGEDAAQLAHAEIHGQLVVGRDPTVIAQQRLVARRAQGQAAILAVARLAVVFVLATRALDAAKTKHLEHVRLLHGSSTRTALHRADFSRRGPLFTLAHDSYDADARDARQRGAARAQLSRETGRQSSLPVGRQQHAVALAGLF